MRTWVNSAPEWLETVPSSSISTQGVLAALGKGEREAIALALNSGADLLLADDRAAAREARRLSLTVTGTLGILARAGEVGLIDLRSALDRLERTNFRVNPKILRQLG